METREIVNLGKFLFFFDIGLRYEVRAQRHRDAHDKNKQTCRRFFLADKRAPGGEEHGMSPGGQALHFVA